MSEENAIHRINYEDKEIILIGTAHVSPESVRQVKETIDTEQPDAVCIELDEGRYQSITAPDQWQNTNLTQVIKEGKTGFLLANIILSNYQKKLADQFGIQSGQEMIQAMTSAQENDCELVLADRSIHTTFSRVWRSCSFWEKSKLIGSVVLSAFDDETITEEELENLKNEDILTAAITELDDSFKGVKKSLVTERDQYLSQKIKNAPGKKIIAVVGAAHVPGITQYIHEEIDLKQLDEKPPKSKVGKVVGWVIPILLVALIIATFFINPNSGWDQTLSWLIMTIAGAGIGALAALAHPISIMTGMVMAPISALNPILAAGWFSGIMETYLRKPKVEDFESVSEDLKSFKGFWKNKVTKVLLVVLLTNLGCAIGNICGGIKVIQVFIDTMF